MNDPNFFSESNGESKGLVDNSPGGGVYPDKKAQSGNFGKKIGSAKCLGRNNSQTVRVAYISFDDCERG